MTFSGARITKQDKVLLLREDGEGVRFLFCGSFRWRTDLPNFAIRHRGSVPSSPRPTRRRAVASPNVTSPIIRCQEEHSAASFPCFTADARRVRLPACFFALPEAHHRDRSGPPLPLERAFQRCRASCRRRSDRPMAAGATSRDGSKICRAPRARHRPRPRTAERRSERAAGTSRRWRCAFRAAARGRTAPCLIF